MTTTIANLWKKNQIDNLKRSKYLETGTETQTYHTQSNIKPEPKQTSSPVPSPAIIWLLIRVTQHTCSNCHATHPAALLPPLRAAQPPCLQLWPCSLPRAAGDLGQHWACLELCQPPSLLAMKGVPRSSSWTYYPLVEMSNSFSITKFPWRCRGVFLLLK